MSRKKTKRGAGEAVPEDILAEGSGAHEAARPSAEALADAAEAALGEAAHDPVGPGSADALAAAGEHVLEDAVLRAEAEAELGAGEEPGADEPGADADAADEAGEELGAALPTTAASMDDAQLKSLVEALVFAADKPVTLQRLRQLTRVSDVRRLEHALAQLDAEYADRGIALQQVSGGYQFRTNTRYSVWVQQLIAGRPVRLSRAQLETLAIIAYRQPITRPEVDEIRGVDSSATLRLLLDRSLIRILGKKEEVGRPLLYGTTKEFLDFFSLGDLRELPTLREYSELTAESRKVITDRLGDDATADDGSSDDEIGEPGAGIVGAHAADFAALDVAGADPLPGAVGEQPVVNIATLDVGGDELSRGTADADHSHDGDKTQGD